MEREKNLTKSFGIRVPLGMYLRMIEVSAERKLSITDICLYALSNSSLIGMSNGGILIQSPTIDEQKYKDEIAYLKEEIVEHKRTIKNLEKLTQSDFIDMRDNHVQKNEMLIYIHYPRTKGGEIRLVGDQIQMDKNNQLICSLLMPFMYRNGYEINSRK